MRILDVGCRMREYPARTSGSQEKARLISKYRLLIDRARRDPQTLLPLMFLIPLRAVAMRIGFYLHRVKPL
jgi:hypothetical protein